MVDIQKDFRHAARALLRNKVFAAAATVTLALGIGCATALFSAFNATVLHPLPYPQAGNLVTIKANADPMGQAWLGMSLPDVLALHDESRIFTSLAYYGNRQPMNLTGARLYAHIDTLRVSPEIFRVLNIRPIMGRWLRNDEARPGLDGVSVISHSLWVQDFGSDPDVIGKTIRLNNKPYRVVGVMPARFSFPDPLVQAWLPVTLTLGL
jgi:putative ABC transport system permease protein